MKGKHIIFILSLMLLASCGLASLPETPVVKEPVPILPPIQTPVSADSIDVTQTALGTPHPMCDDYSFDLATVDVTIPEGTIMNPGQGFTKTWKIKNTGACTWDDYSLIYAGYMDKMSSDDHVRLDILVEPGQEVEISVNFKAPKAVGEYVSAWQMANAKGIPFGKAIFVKIVVK